MLKIEVTVYVDGDQQNYKKNPKMSIITIGIKKSNLDIFSMN
jgi:hypothetical protein